VLVIPSLMAPFHLAIIGTLIPPSNKSLLKPFKLPLLLKYSGSAPPSLCGPLSEVKIIMVLFF
jgi:hypothetical protein